MAVFIFKKLTSEWINKHRLFRNVSSTNFLNSDKVPEEFIPKNILAEYYNDDKQQYGEVYDVKPFKMKLEANKKYSWCACGKSKSQPLCDGTHKIEKLKITIKPIRFMVAETKEYWLCNCKRSRHRPFCDGTHKTEEVLNLAPKHKLPQ